MAKWREVVSGLFALALLAYTWAALVPQGFLNSLDNPAHAATLGGVVGLVVLLVTLVWAPANPKILPMLAALVLASMPVFYLWAATLSNQPDAIASELIGLMIFVAWALYGYRRSHRALGLGIMAHGLLWDSWHHQGSDIIAPWYPGACLLFDVAVGLVLLLRFTRSTPPAPPTSPT
jgi:hypothetical protein